MHALVFGGLPEKARMELVGGIKGLQIRRSDDISIWAHYFLGDKVKNVTYARLPRAFYSPHSLVSNVLT